MRTRRALRARPRNELTYLRIGSQIRRAADEAFDQRRPTLLPANVRAFAVDLFQAGQLRDEQGAPMTDVSQLRELVGDEYCQGVAHDGIDQRPARRARR